MYKDKNLSVIIKFVKKVINSDFLNGINKCTDDYDNFQNQKSFRLSFVLLY